MGVTLDNKGNVKNYTNFRVNESPLDRIADGPMDLKNGTVDIDSVMSTNQDNVEFMHDVLPSPNEDEFDYETFGKFSDEMRANKDQYEYDIDELEDYSTQEMSEMYDENQQEFDTSTDDNLEETVDYLPKYDWLTNEESDELEDLSGVVSDINESLDMFKRFRKYN
jgi:hypothetical protein